MSFSMSNQSSSHAKQLKSLSISHISNDNALHKLETLGSSLPVQVSEVLLLTDRHAEVSVCISERGLAWLVCGRRLFIWKFTSPKGSKSLPNCRELILSPSDLAHQARLICVYSQPDSLIPSCIAVSPEGTIRYWPSIAQESSTIEFSADLQGQECESLINLQPLGCLLSTTTGTLMLVIPSNIQGQKLTCRPLKIPHGLLGGISRRVSSLFFGGLPSQSSESRLVKVVAADESEGKIVFVLSSDSLKKWVIKSNDPDDLIYSCEVERIFKENFLTAIWGRDRTHPSNIKIWVMDINVYDDSIFVLAAAVNMQSPENIYYGLGSMKVFAPDPLIAFPNFISLKCSQSYSSQDEEILTNYKFLINDKFLFLYQGNIIKCFNVTTGEESDIIKLHSPRDRIIGAGSFREKPCFFSFNSGILFLSRIFDDSIVDAPNMSARDTTLDYSMSNVTFDETCIMSLATSNNQMERLKKAIILFHQNKMTQCQLELKALFPLSSIYNSQIDSPLDTLIIQFCQESIMDDSPSADPRWAEQIKPGSLSSTSLIILHQLQEKFTVLQLVMKFIKKTGLWNKLGVVSVRKGTMSTSLLLCELAEKIVAAITLKKIHVQFVSLLKPAIEKIVVQYRNLLVDGKLTHTDLFYSQVTRIGDIFTALVDNLIEIPVTEIPVQDMCRKISDTNFLLQEMLQKILQYRQDHKMEYITPSQSELESEYIPWTSSEYQGLRGSLLKLHKITLEHGIKLTEDADLQTTLFNQLVCLSDVIIDGYRMELISLPSNIQSNFIPTYEQERFRLIWPFFKEGLYDKAAFLAEKYQDFLILVQLCDVNDDDIQLEKYMDQFADVGICSFVFKWLYDEGKFQKLLTISHHRNELSLFLKDYPSLSWLDLLSNGKYLQAADILFHLATSETKYLNKKKSYLTFYKLAVYASDAGVVESKLMYEKYDKQMELVLLQETLPAAVVEAFGMDTDSMKVLRPHELIEIYISPKNSEANEFDFKKSLDLLEFIGEQETQLDYRLHIWCSCILRDEWDEIEPGIALQVLEETLFFKTLVLAFAQGHDLEDIIPNLNKVLNKSEMDKFDKSHLEYALRTAIEYVTDITGGK